MEQMNALVAAHMERKPLANIENIPPLKKGGKENEQDTKAKGIRCKKTLCPYCKALVHHKPKNATHSRQTKTRDGLGGSWSRRRQPDRD